ncbi:hypothetical protein PLESTF_001435900 [Pleodorina starrii]|nr:hypothetical protein PLESTM_000676000 [Pleodorina starrii]GLC73906.1 hypothetical protein PLESTF_001435900 [Pleodorina starrii]
MASMAEDYRQTYREVEQRKHAPEYNLNVIHQNLESLGDPLNAVLKIVEARNKRMTVDQQRAEANRRLQEQLAKQHEQEVAQREQEEAEQEAAQEAQPPPDAPQEPSEPQVMEAMTLTPPQPLPAVDLSPLGLPDSLSHSEAMALLQQLLVTRQLWGYVGVTDGQSASPVLRVLFDVVAYGENPYNSYQQLVRYYGKADPTDLGWVPQLPNFFTALTTLGYQPPRGSRKRGGSGEGSSPGDGEAGGSSGGGGGGGGLGARLLNLQALLRLLADLTRLHREGRVDLGFGSQGQAAFKGLLTALLRMLLDPVLAPRLLSDVVAALEGLMRSWDEPAWRRICDDAAAAAAELGPSHRAAYRAITTAQGLSERLRVWQQCAAMQLLRKTLPQSAAGGSGAGGGVSQRGHVGVDITQVQKLLGRASAASVKSLVKSLSRERGGAPDYWRLLTVLQCAHLVVWHTASVAEAGETDEVVRWMCSYLKAVEQGLRGQQDTVMRIKVFLADVTTNYELLAGLGE